MVDLSANERNRFMPYLKEDRSYPKNIEFIIQPLHGKCKGCENAKSNNTCKSYANPSFWWEQRPAVEGRQFWCPRATHLEMVEPELHKKLNPIKASKRRFR